MAHFGDPNFQYHVAAAQIWGTVTLRMADSNALPFDYTDYASELQNFVNETVRNGEPEKAWQCVRRQANAEGRR
jgi:hypothetical protein